MKREIKFRAWDGKNMFTPNVIAFGDCDWSSSKGRGMSIPYQPHIILMQFTGLKDKNSKEIYEGDIVSWKVSPMRGTSKISFYDGSFRVSDYPTEDNTLNEGFCKNCCEIIGNIYETPELIKS